ncbi:MAG TPA: GNAT family N-acetyltransferase [Lactobacillaceae bacterium]|jgi:predicted GNAT family N-acyltransferase
MVNILTQFGQGDVTAAALRIRFAVFVDEQGFAASDELDALDVESWHLVAYDGETAIATARLHEDTPGIWHVQRVATLRDFRGRGLGRLLFERIEQFAKEHQITQLTLGAQLPAQGFYEKLGFHAHGEQFLDAGAPHIEMTKKL